MQSPNGHPAVNTADIQRPTFKLIEPQRIPEEEKLETPEVPFSRPSFVQSKCPSTG